MTCRGPRATGFTIGRRRPASWPWLLPLLLAAAAVGLFSRDTAPLLAAGGAVSEALVQPRRVRYESWARAEFERRYPGEKPVNWAVAEAAEAIWRAESMGPFVLGLGEPGNDCSDFVDCAIDQGLGVGSRISRGEPEHRFGESSLVVYRFVWRPGLAVQPGDAVSIEHSPWYTPYDGACWHCGIVGTDGQVLDFTKLKRWSGPRYGRQTFAQFTRHSREPGQVVIARLRPQYRYRIEPLPEW